MIGFLEVVWRASEREMGSKGERGEQKPERGPRREVRSLLGER